MTTEWIEHHGKGYPDLPMDTLVQVRFADGEEDLWPWVTVEYWGTNWRHSEPQHPCDITYYRVVSQ